MIIQMVKHYLQENIWQVQSGMHPCLTAQIWRPACAAHKSNGAHALVNDVGEVRLVCLHPSCHQRGECNRRLIGLIPLSLLQTTPRVAPDVESPTGNQAVASMPGSLSHSNMPKRRPKLVSQPVHSRPVRPTPLPTSLDPVDEMQTGSDVEKTGARRPADECSTPIPAPKVPSSRSPPLCLNNTSPCDKASRRWSVRTKL